VTVTEVGSVALTTPSSTQTPTGAWDWEPLATTFPEGAEELDLLVDVTALEEDIVYPGQQPWLNRQ